MVLIMYIIIAPVVRTEILWWQPLGCTATYFIGLAVAILVSLVPKLNLAISTIHEQLSRLEKDFTMLLRQCKHYEENASSATPTESRGALASIEMLQHRIDRTIHTLNNNLAASQTELYVTCRPTAATDLGEWVEEARLLSSLVRSLCTALANRVLGEEHPFFSASLREAKGVINDQVSASRDRLVDAMLSSIAVCHAWADPSTHRVVLPDVHEELQAAIEDSRHNFQFALQRAAGVFKQNHSKESSSHQNPETPLLAHLTRRISAFHALLELAQSLLHYLNQHNWEAEEIKQSKLKSQVLSSSNLLGSLRSCVEAKWLWHKPDSFRLAFKTAVGMFLASLFVSIPHLYNLAAPFGIWPGLTIASVNLGDTGSSFRKAGDRLFGTLLAAAYALLVTDLFPGTQDYIKVPAIGIFTFILIYLKSEDHAYAYTYAATSIGSMLYGSVFKEVEIIGYIPKRIELIFTGIAIFSFVELLLFPRSSRRLVEQLSLKCFSQVRAFAEQATISAQRMQTLMHRETTPNDYDDELMLVREDDDPFQLQKLRALHSELKSLSDRLKRELKAGVGEPHVGFSLHLDSKSYLGFSVEISDCASQAALLLLSFQNISQDSNLHCYDEEYNQSKRVLRHTSTWLAEFMGQVFRVTEFAWQKLKAAYPDGHLRPQGGNAVRAVLAASSLREFQDVRLQIMSDWSTIYAKAMENNRNEYEDVHTPAVAIMTLSVSTSQILELCRHLQTAGRHAEAIAHGFPASK